MLVLEGDESAAADESAEEENEDVKDVGLLLEALQGELDAARNFEMVQALLARVLVVSLGWGYRVCESSWCWEVWVQPEMVQALLVCVLVVSCC